MTQRHYELRVSDGVVEVLSDIFVDSDSDLAAVTGIVSRMQKPPAGHVSLEWNEPDWTHVKLIRTEPCPRLIVLELEREH